MDVLKITTRFGELIGLCIGKNAPRKERVLSFVVNFVFVFSLLLYLGGSTALIIISYPDDLPTVSFCMLEFLATIALLGPYVMSIKQKSAVMDLINSIQALVWQSKTPSASKWSIRSFQFHPSFSVALQLRWIINRLHYSRELNAKLVGLGNGHFWSISSLSVVSKWLLIYITQ